MATTLTEWRPSALAAACPSIVPAIPAGVRTEPRYRALAALGEPSMRIGALAEMAGAGDHGAVKINNYMGAPTAVPATGLAVTGAATSSVVALGMDDLRNQQHGADTVKGFIARGIPPRGRRRV